MSLSGRILFLCVFSLLAACQLPSLEDRYAKKHRGKQPVASDSDADAVDMDWEPALPGRDLTREEALAYAVREILAGLAPEERLRILSTLVPDEPAIGPFRPEPEPVFDAPSLCGELTPLCATPEQRPDLVRLPAVSAPSPAVVIAQRAHERLVLWTPKPKVAADVLPPTPLLAGILSELTFRLGSEELAAAALLLGTDIERRIEAARAKAQKPPSLNRVLGWLPSKRVPLFERAKEAVTLCQLYALSWPVSRRWSLTSGFGYRVHPIYGTLRLHKGVDVAVPIGTEIRAPSAATVRKVKEDTRNGKWMELNHGNGVTTVYCHASELKLPKGAKVNAGDVIALSGDTGVATGPHLHYQLHLAREAVDPLRFRAATAEAMVNTAQATATGGSL